MAYNSRLSRSDLLIGKQMYPYKINALTERATCMTSQAQTSPRRDLDRRHHLQSNLAHLSGLNVEDKPSGALRHLAVYELARAYKLNVLASTLCDTAFQSANLYQELSGGTTYAVSHGR